MLIETLTFRLGPGADEAAFLDADRRVQAAISPRRGFLRRTTARADDGEWLVIELWRSAEDADAAAPASHLATEGPEGAFLAMLDPASVRTARYTTLD